MDICSHNHEEIVYNSKYCPLCSAIDDKDRLIELMEELEEDRDKYEELYNNLLEEVQKYSPEILI